MTEQEAVEIIDEKTREETLYQIEPLDRPYIIAEAERIAISALEEIQQYRALGTLEELRETREKQVPKRPSFEGDGYDDEGNTIYDTWICPCCNKDYEVDYDEYDYCPDCGQAIDWSDYK